MKLPSTLFASLICLGLINVPAWGQINLTTTGIAYTQDFNTLADTGLSSVTPTGWAFSESGSNANNTYAANDGTNNAGNTYSYGSTGSPDRAFGGLQSSSLVPTIGAIFINNTGVTITSLAVSYFGEEWRCGTTGRNDSILFQLSFDSSAWTRFPALDFVSPNVSTVGAKNGNDSTNRRTVSSTISGFVIPQGMTFFIRWNDANASGADDGLAVDDFSLTPFGSLLNTVSWSSASGDSQWFNPANWSLARVPLQTDTVIIPTGTPSVAPIISGGNATVAELRLDGRLNIGVGGTLIVGRDVVINGILSAGPGTIVCGRNWIRGETSQFLEGSSIVRFTGRGIFRRNFYNVIVDSGSAMKSNGNIVVGNRFEARGLDTLRSMDTLFIQRADLTGLIGTVKIVGGTIRRNIQPGVPARYRFESDSTYVRFRSGMFPFTVTMTAYPDTNPLTFGTNWTSVPSVVDTLTNSVRADSVRSFSRWGMGIPIVGSSLTTFVRRVYSIKSDSNFVADLSLRYEQTEALGINESAIRLYRLDIPVGTPEDAADVPTGFSLSQNYPNPFNPTTTIQYRLPVESRVTLTIFDILGQEVRTLVNRVDDAGTHRIEWNARDNEGKALGSGVYVYRLEAVSTSLPRRSSLLSRKMLVLK